MSNYRSASVKSPIIISIIIQEKKHLSLILQMYSGSLMFMLNLVYGWSGCVTSGECSMHRQLSQDSHNISGDIVFVLLLVVCFVISCLLLLSVVCCCYQLFVSLSVVCFVLHNNLS